MLKSTQKMRLLCIGVFCMSTSSITSIYAHNGQTPPLSDNDSLVSQEINYESVDSIVSKSNSFTIVEVESNSRESLFPKANRSLETSHFTWGADVGASIDLTGYDMSTFDIDVVFGYKNKLIKLLGVGAGMQRSFGAENMFIPVYAVFRSSFRTKPSLFFMSVKAGYSFNTLADSATYGDVFASLGCGINLAMSKKFQSHIIVGWGFRHFGKRHRTNLNLDARNINLANISFGVNF